MAAIRGRRQRTASTTLDRHPTHPGEVWVHIDRFDKPSRRVWAVQYMKRRAGTWRPVYMTAEEVSLRTFCHTREHLDGRQPKAYLVASPARVKWLGAVAVVEDDDRG